MIGQKNQIMILWARELKHLLFSPLAAVSILFFLLGTGIPFFFAGLSVSAAATGFRQFCSLIPYVSAVVISALTMGLWADEERSGTSDLVRSWPVGETSIIVAKFLAALAVYAVCLALTVPVVVIAPIAGPASRFIQSGTGSILCAYIMLALSGAAACAVGLFCSVLFRSAAASFFSSAAVLLGFGWFSARNLDAAARGIVDTRDVLVFLIPCALALYASVLVISAQKGRSGKRRAAGPILFFVSCLVLVPLASARFHARLDMTESKIYSLSPFTQKILSNLRSEVRITWYRSADLAKLTPNARTIDDFLDEYRAASNGMLSYSMLDPASDKTTDVESLGIASRQIDVKERDATVAKNIYSGILLEHDGSTRVIPFIVDQSSLEYDLTRLIAETDDSPETAFMQRKEISVLYGNQGGPGFYPYVAQSLAYAGFTVRVPTLPIHSFEPDKPLVVLGSANVDPDTANAISSFLDAGGSAVFFVSGTTINTASDWKAVPKIRDNLLALLGRYGVVIEPDLILDKSNWPLTMPSADGTKYETVRYPFWVRTEAYARDKKSPMLNGTDALQFYWPSSILIDSNTDQTLAPLVESSDDSITMESPFDTGPFGKQVGLVEKSNKKARAKIAVASVAKGRTVYVADEYCESAMLDYAESSSNLAFLVNSVEWISGRDRLLELKKSPTALSPVTARETASIQLYFHVARIVMIAAIPLIVIILGVILFAIRRRKR